MHSLLYILLLVSLFFITASSLPVPASDDRQDTTPGQLIDPSREGWAASYGGAGEDWASSIQQTREGGYIVAGLTNSFGTEGPDSWVLKLRPDGYLHPSCDFVWDIIVLETRSNAAILDTSASVKNSYADPQDSSATILDTDASAEIQCPAAPYYYDKPIQFQPPNIPQETLSP